MDVVLMSQSVTESGLDPTALRLIGMIAVSCDVMKGSGYAAVMKCLRDTLQECYPNVRLVALVRTELVSQNEQVDRAVLTGDGYVASRSPAMSGARFPEGWS